MNQGENAFYFAGLGRMVTSIGFLEVPISRARQKAAERGLAAPFLVMDDVTFKGRTEQFDNVIDSGLSHVFNDEDRRRYVEGQAVILKPVVGCSCSASATRRWGLKGLEGYHGKKLRSPSPRGGSA